jgi:hypothetical protein
LIEKPLGVSQNGAFTKAKELCAELKDVAARDFRPWVLTALGLQSLPCSPEAGCSPAALLPPGLPRRIGRSTSS